MKRYCVNFQCESVPKCVLVEHFDLGRTMEPGKTAQYTKLKCSVCGHESNEIVPRVAPRKQVGRFYHEGLGQTFDDRDHEKKWTKENGYTPV